MGEIFGIAIVRPFGIILMAIYNVVGSYGLAVIAFALIVKLLLIPLAIKSKKSMLAMTAMQNELQQIQKQYANNREKMAAEQQRLYEKHGVSPMSGCLTQFIQFPIMMGLYYAVQQPLKFMIGLSDTSIALLAQKVGVDMAKVGYTAQITVAEKLNTFVNPDGTFPTEITSLAEDIRKYLVNIDFSFFGLNLAETPNITKPSMIWIIPILSAVTAFLSSFIMQKMQSLRADQPVQQNGSMKAMILLMPLMSGYFAFILPAAIGIYWIFNNIFTCLQEVVLTQMFRKKQAKADEAQAMIDEEKARERKRKAQEAAALQAERKGKKK